MFGTKVLLFGKVLSSKCHFVAFMLLNLLGVGLRTGASVYSLGICFNLRFSSKIL